MDNNKIIQDLHVHVNRNLFENNKGDKFMKFKDFKHLVDMNENRVVFIWYKHTYIGRYSFGYDKRELFYKAFLEDTTFDNDLVVGVCPHYDEWGDADGLTISVEDSNEL